MGFASESLAGINQPREAGDVVLLVSLVVSSSGSRVSTTASLVTCMPFFFFESSSSSSLASFKLLLQPCLALSSQPMAGQLPHLSTGVNCRPLVPRQTTLAGLNHGSTAVPRPFHDMLPITMIDPPPQSCHAIVILAALLRLVYIACLDLFLSTYTILVTRVV